MASASLAGCIGGDTGQPDADPAAANTGTATDTPTGTPTGPTVQLRSDDELGDVLVGPGEMTLYMFDSDTRGAAESTCSGDCADAWPPLTLQDGPTGGPGVTAELTTFQREDGATQVAAAGWPLYYFASDQQPGDVTGQGVNDVWWVLRPDGTPVRADSTPGTSTEEGTDNPTEEATDTQTEGETGTATDDGMAAPVVQVRSHPELGDILVGPGGMTLYMFDSDTRGAAETTCSGDCAAAWPPLTIDGGPTSGEEVTAELTTFQREDGSTQVAAAGWPLYYFASDQQPGDVAGQGVNGVWWVLRPDGTPVRAGTGTATATGGTPTPTPTPTEEDDPGGGGY